MSELRLTTDSIPSPHSLPNKPLVEAVFELHWHLEKKVDESEVDPGFRILLGRFFDKVKTSYPAVVDLPVAQIPEAMVPHVVRHQFRASKDGWPLIQLGPGILSINETSNYRWETFRPMLEGGLNSLQASYPTEIYAFRPARIILRYINGISNESTGSQLSVIDFLRDQLHTRIEVEPALFETADEWRFPEIARLHLAYPLSKPKASGRLAFAFGGASDPSNLLLEISIDSAKNGVPDSVSGIMQWLDDAHRIVDKWFFGLVRGELLNRFEQENAD